MSAVSDAVPAPSGTPDAGVPWHYGSPLIEQRHLAAGTAVVRTADRVLRVSGPDRLTWLNAITSQLMLPLAAGDSTEALILSPQGQVEHSLRAVADSDSVWVLAEPTTAAGDYVQSDPHPLLAWLERMRFRAEVTLEDLSAEYAGLSGTPAAVAAVLAASGLAGCPVWVDPWPGIAPGGATYAAATEHPGLARPHAVGIVPRADALTLPDGFTWAGTWAATALRIEAWRPRLGADTDARTLPHELDWTRTAVHFDKGCYRGQETVAKVFNLGQPPRRMALLHLDGSGHSLPVAGAAVHLPDATDARALGKPVGRLLSVALHHELGPIALAMLKRSTPLDAALLVEPPALDDGESADDSTPRQDPLEPPIAAAQEPIVREREHGGRPTVSRLHRP
ncbi:folate-binding protein YgfZ [Micrococcales bacterium 31B]|nr:folate-binding protein YgfZ [Micrococcales bacterium 31B]